MVFLILCGAPQNPTVNHNSSLSKWLFDFCAIFRHTQVSNSSIIHCHQLKWLKDESAIIIRARFFQLDKPLLWWLNFVLVGENQGDSRMCWQKTSASLSHHFWNTTIFFPSHANLPPMNCFRSFKWYVLKSQWWCLNSNFCYHKSNNLCLES